MQLRRPSSYRGFTADKPKHLINHPRRAGKQTLGDMMFGISEVETVELSQEMKEILLKSNGLNHRILPQRNVGVPNNAMTCADPQNTEPATFEKIKELIASIPPPPFLVVTVNETGLGKLQEELNSQPNIKIGVDINQSVLNGSQVYHNPLSGVSVYTVKNQEVDYLFWNDRQELENYLLIKKGQIRLTELLNRRRNENTEKDT